METQVSTSATLDDSTSPTSILIPALDGVTEGTYRFWIRVVSDRYSYISASYTHEVQVKELADTCDAARVIVLGDTVQEIEAAYGSIISIQVEFWSSVANC